MTNRRSFMAALGAGYAMASQGFGQAQRGNRAAAPARNSELFFTADTPYGKVQGMANAGIKEFKGIPYGASTAGKNRYMPPQKPAAWTGVKECLAYGQISPQTISPPASDYSQLIQWDLHYGTGMGEDVLTLNVWTPGIKDGGKRAVMVSFHGGGFATGSGNGPQYDGTQLSQLTDVRRRHGESSARELRISASCRSGRAAGIRACGRRGNDGSGRVARVGARQHRKLRRRSGQGHDLRAIGRRREDFDHARDSFGKRLVPRRGHSERIDHSFGHARARHEVG